MKPIYLALGQRPLEGMGTSTGVGGDRIVDPRNLSIWRLFHLPPILMFATVSHLTELPIEILEQIFLHLPGQDVIRIEAVWGVVSSFVRSGFDSTYLA